MSHTLRTRKPTRQPGIDYTRPGFYFVTICTKEKEDVLGKIDGETINLNELGRIVHKCWLVLPDHYRCCRLHEFVIMPNHVHGIIEIVGGPGVGQDSHVGAGLRPARLDKSAIYTRPSHSSPHPASLSEIIRAFKTFSARAINQKFPDGLFQWQRSFHDRVIRDKGELIAIGRYIVQNPLHWAEDEENFT